MRPLSIAPLPVPREEVRAATAVRTTLLASSIAAIRAAGHGERYEKLLAPSMRDAVLLAPAGMWVPIDVAEAHYAACDALGLAADEMFAIGGAVSKVVTTRIGMFLTGAIAESGVTPWTMVKISPRFWGRWYQGSAVCGARYAPKECRFEVVAHPLARIRYWREGLRGIVATLCGGFCARIYVKEERRTTDGLGVTYRMQWV